MTNMVRNYFAIGLADFRARIAGTELSGPAADAVYTHVLLKGTAI
jgi:hypothetical protein